MTADQEQILEQIRGQTRELARSITAAGDAGLPPAVLVPELITVLKEEGFSVPRIPFLGSLGGG